MVPLIRVSERLSIYGMLRADLCHRTRSECSSWLVGTCIGPSTWTGITEGP